MARKLVPNRVSGRVVNTRNGEQSISWGEGIVKVGVGQSIPLVEGLSMTIFVEISITYLQFEVKEGTLRLSDPVGLHQLHTAGPVELI